MKSEAAKIASRWSAQLGLAATPLRPKAGGEEVEHFALLDGVRASFALTASRHFVDDLLDWTWSSNFDRHVLVGTDKIDVRTIGDDARVDSFDRHAVETHLERFFDILRTDRRTPAVRAISHVTELFRRHRGAAASAGLNALETLRSFLAGLLQVSGENTASISAEQRAALAKLPADHLERLAEELRFNAIVGRHLKVDLLFRHAAGALFQEAHAQLVGPPAEPTLFGLPNARTAAVPTRSGAFYTPPGLARVLADLTLASHLAKTSITVLDPACGSGIFLAEAALALARAGWGGHLRLLGRDLSPIAIEAARFTLGNLPEAADSDCEIEASDFLESDIDERADVVLMNPPFLAYQAMNDTQRTAVQAILGDAFRYRPDLSAAFIEKALATLAPSGSLGTLVPAGVLSSDSSAQWRERLSERHTIRSIGVLGDHGLFRGAMVNVGFLVLETNLPKPWPSPVMVWSSERPGASSAALRRLRRWRMGAQQAEANQDWSIYLAEHDELTASRPWLPRPNRLGPLVRRLTETVRTRIADLFDIHLGIRTGNRSLFVISRAVHEALPKGERIFFRSIAEKTAISSGRIHTENFLFFPPKSMTVAEVAKACPRYYAYNIAERDLAVDQVLDLARSRRTLFERFESRIVSRAFAGVGGFAVDSGGRHVVVQGYAWVPHTSLKRDIEGIDDLLLDYTFIFNSTVFAMLVREFSQTVSGGQADLARKFVKNIPLPNLPELYRLNPALLAEAERLRAQDSNAFPPLPELNHFAAVAYGTHLDDWPFDS